LQSNPVKKTVGADAAAAVTTLRRLSGTGSISTTTIESAIHVVGGDTIRTADTNLQAYATFCASEWRGVRGGAEQPAAPGGGRGGRGGGGGAQAGSSDDIVGSPIGHDGLMSELAHEMIPYTPEELIDIAKQRDGLVLERNEARFARSGLRR